MKDAILAYGIGAVCGSRSLLVPALIAGSSPGRWPVHGPLGAASRLPGGRWMMIAMAVGEVIADKSSRIPARTGALPLAARLTTGALSAAACARPGRRVSAAGAGAAGALTGTYLFFHLRRLATTRLPASNLAAGTGEDVLALGLGALMMRCR